METLILFIAEDFPPNRGGTSEYSINLAKSIKSMGYNLIVIAPHTNGDGDYDLSSGLKTFRVGHLDSRQKKMGLRGRLEAVRKFEFEINEIISDLMEKNRVSFAFVSSVSTWANLCRKHKIPYGVAVHGGDAFGHRTDRLRTAYRNFAVKKVMKHAKAVFSNSDYTKCMLMNIGVDEAKIFTTYCGVAEPFVKAADKCRDVQRNLNQLLMMCRLVSIKACDAVITAMTLVREKYPQIRLIVAGDGPQIDKLRTLTSRLALDDVVHFIGYVTDKQQKALLLRQSSILVQSGRIDKSDKRAEAFGIVFAEAAICECPSIGPDLGGVPEVIVNGHTGILVEPDDVENVSKAVETILTDKDLYFKMGTFAKRRAEELFNYDRIAEMIVNLLC